MRNSLTDIFKSKTVIVGIGNTMKGDDGFGPLLVRRLKSRIKTSCIDAGVTPENYVGLIAKEKPGNILLIDSADLDSNPGDCQILKKEELLKSGFTTHDISAGMFIEYLEKRTRAKIFLLGVQPENVSFGAEMSESVSKTLESALDLIVETHNA